MHLNDRYTLHLLYNLMQQVTGAYEEFNYSRVVSLIDKFNSSSVSAFHAHITKDRMYCSRQSDAGRRSAQTVQFHLLDVLTRLVAPILPHLAEETHLYHPLNVAGSNDGGVFRRRWPEARPEWNCPQLAASMDIALSLRDALNSIVTCDKPGDYDVIIACDSPLFSVLKSLQKEVASVDSELCELMQCASLTLTNEVASDSLPSIDGATTIHRNCVVVNADDVSTIGVEASYSLSIRPARGHQCQRCRRRTSDTVNSLCSRCSDVIGRRL
jgi:isoleucyl-tRNA synthetase